MLTCAAVNAGEVRRREEEEREERERERVREEWKEEMERLRVRVRRAEERRAEEARERRWKEMEEMEMEKQAWEEEVGADVEDGKEGKAEVGKETRIVERDPKPERDESPQTLTTPEAERKSTSASTLTPTTPSTKTATLPTTEPETQAEPEPPSPVPAATPTPSPPPPPPPARTPFETEHLIASLMHTRIARILALFQHAGTPHLVLGSFGTGVFQNDTRLVARIFWDLLAREGAPFAGAFESVVFAILGSGTVRVFREVFACPEEEGDGEEEEEEEEGRKEDVDLFYDDAGDRDRDVGHGAQDGRADGGDAATVAGGGVANTDDAQSLPEIQMDTGETKSNPEDSQWQWGADGSADVEMLDVLPPPSILDREHTFTPA